MLLRECVYCQLLVTATVKFEVEFLQWECVRLQSGGLICDRARWQLLALAIACSSCKNALGQRDLFRFLIWRQVRNGAQRACSRETGVKHLYSITLARDSRANRHNIGPYMTHVDRRELV